MKKYFLTILAATLAIVGCSKINGDTPQLNSEPDQLIDFVAANYQTSTKAGPSAFPTDDSFKVKAYYTGQPKWSDGIADAVVYIDGVEATYANDTWSCGNYYWPKTGNLSFIGYTHFGETAITWGTTQNPLMSVAGYNIITNPTADLMITDIATNRNANATAGYNTAVPMLFHHILSGIKFLAKEVVKENVEDPVEHHIVVKKITIKNHFTSGNLSVDGRKGEGDSDETVNLKINWTDTGDKSTGQVFYEDENDSPQSVGGTYTTSAHPHALTSDWSPLLGSGKFTYILPQTINDEVIAVEYYIYYCNSTEKILDVLHETKEFNIIDLIDQGWDPNKVYSYNFTINPYLENKITFYPTVADWDTVIESDDTDVPLNN